MKCESESTGLKSVLNLKRLSAVAVLIGFFAVSPHLFGESVLLSWDASATPDVVSYRVYYGNASGSYSSFTNVGDQTEAVITGLQPGMNYFFAATAVDIIGLESLPSDEISFQIPATSPSPVISLTSPVSGATYTAPANINLAASVAANGHTISKVQFYNGSTLLGEDASSPYSFTWNNAGSGNYTLSARVVYDFSSTADSSSVSIVVSNPLPTVALTSPINGASYIAPATIAMAASVAANGHTITRVQFYNGTSLLGEDTSAPYSFIWNNANAGSYNLTASVTYDSGSIVASSSANITVSEPALANLPTPWQTMDLGAVNLPGSANLSNGVYTVAGSGTMASTADSFRFVYQPLSGDGEIRCQLASVGSTAVNATFGAMIRESLTAGSAYSLMGVLQSDRFRWQHRNVTSGSTTSKNVKGGSSNMWVKLVRTGSTFSGYKSTDGIKWTLVSSRTIKMAANIYIGLAVSSGSSTTLKTSSFSSVTVVP